MSRHLTRSQVARSVVGGLSVMIVVMALLFTAARHFSGIAS